MFTTGCDRFVIIYNLAATEARLGFYRQRNRGLQNSCHGNPLDLAKKFIVLFKMISTIEYCEDHLFIPKQFFIEILSSNLNLRPASKEYSCIAGITSIKVSSMSIGPSL